MKTTVAPHRQLALGILVSLTCLGATQAIADEMARPVDQADTAVDAYTGAYDAAESYSSTADTYVDDAGNYVAPAVEGVAPEAVYTEDSNVYGEAAIAPAPTYIDETPNIPIFVDGSAGGTADVATPSYESAPTDSGGSYVSDVDLPAGYYTQIGAFGNVENANRVRAEAASRHGVGAHVVKDRNSPYYKVQVGPFATDSEAFALSNTYPGKLLYIQH